jgi:hypothetical protein
MRLPSPGVRLDSASHGAQQKPDAADRSLGDLALVGA